MIANMERGTFLDLLNEFKRLNISESINFEEMNDVLISHHSTAIEGSSLTEEETLLLLTEGLTAKGKPLQDHNMVKDHHNALLKTLELAKEKREVTPDMLKMISSLVMKNTGSVISSMAGDYDSSRGNFRKSAVRVGNRYFTNYQKVPQEVEELCNEINTRINAVGSELDIYNLAFDAHFALVSIHPFADGNGRVSRLLMNYVLQYKEQPLALIFKEDKIDYYKALEDARIQNDMKPFYDFLYAQQEKYLSQEINKFNLT